jgi:hypothetical protein
VRVLECENNEDNLEYFNDMCYKKGDGMNFDKLIGAYLNGMACQATASVAPTMTPLRAWLFSPIK